MSKGRQRRAAATLPASILKINPHLAATAGGADPAACGSQKNGARWEDEVEGGLQALFAANVVASYQRHDARKIERKGVVVGRIPGASDFTGILASGVGFCVECKSTASARGAIHASPEHAEAARRARDPALTTEQRTQLDAYLRAGCPALLAARVGALRAFVPWAEVRGAAAIGQESLVPWSLHRGEALGDALARLVARPGGTEHPPRRVAQ